MPKGVYKRNQAYRGKFTLGSVHSTPSGDIAVVEEPRRVGQNYRLVIRFLATGTVLDCQQNNLSQGKVKDFNVPTVYGVGYIGSSLKIPQRGRGTIRRAYDLWANMLKRAYGGFDPSYVDVTVHARWHSFTNFLNTLPLVPGYASWEDGAELHFDKDKRVPGSRVYSLDTCWFIPPEQNLSK